ncbi:hypothetical protein ACFV9C_43815 [Kribbella sp. NPDC059898]|uniref:hypothetical protein n=1 Tax=Kribbella sp. NPDC059898 TaxID=3346995 RepID=UPI00365B4510
MADDLGADVARSSSSFEDYGVRMTEIDIAGLKKEIVLAALYHRAAAVGAGSLHPRVEDELSVASARELWRAHGQLVDQSRRGFRRIKHIRFDYLHGRLLKVTFLGRTSVDVTGFDRQYGPGAAIRVVDRLRSGASIKESAE